MSKPRSGQGYPRLAPLALVGATALPASLGCALSVDSTTAAPQTTSSAAGGSSIPAAPATDDALLPDSVDPVDGARAGLVADLERAASSVPPPEPVTGEGNDAVTTAVPLPPVDPALAERMERFGSLHLGYDYRDDPGAKATAMAGLATPELTEQLVAPLPAALVEELALEERVVTPTLVMVEAVEPLPGGGGVYRLDFSVETSTVPAPDADAEVDSNVVSLVLAVGSDGLIEDVR